jgi:hypothetical protein
MQPHPGAPNPIWSSLMAACGSGLLIFAKYMDWHLPTWLVFLIGAFSAVGFLVAALGYLLWAIKWLRYLKVEPPSWLVISGEIGRRFWKPFFLGALIAATIAFTLDGYLHPQNNTSVASNSGPPPPPPAPSPAPETPAPKSSLETLIAANRSLPTADKERLSNALFDFAQLIDQANAVFAAINIADAELTTAYQTGVIATELELYRGKLIAAQALDKEFEKSFLSQREKWKYYQTNFDYVFGPNPDGSMHLARNGIEDYLNYLERWAKIENKTEQPILQLLWWPQIKLHGFVYDFSHWKQESLARLDQVRGSLNREAAK